MLYADDAAVVRSPNGLARMMIVMVRAVGASRLPVSGKPTETLLTKVPEKPPRRKSHQHHLPHHWLSAQQTKSTHKPRSFDTWVSSS